jgi:hypothetical protein
VDGEVDDVGLGVGDGLGEGFGDLYAVDGGGEDASGVSGAFAGGVEALGVDALECFVAGDSDGGGGAGLWLERVLR